MEIFGVVFFENLNAAKNEMNCIYVVVSQFLLVVGNINANYTSLSTEKQPRWSKNWVNTWGTPQNFPHCMTNL